MGLTPGPRPLTGIVGARGTPLWLVCEEGTWVPVDVLRLPEVSLMPCWGSSRSSRFLSSDSVFLCVFVILKKGRKREPSMSSWGCPMAVGSAGHGASVGSWRGQGSGPGSE